MADHPNAPPLTADDIAAVMVDAIERAIAPLLTRLTVLEHQTATLPDLRDRVAALDARAIPPSVVLDALATLRERLATLEARAAPQDVR